MPLSAERDEYPGPLWSCALLNYGGMWMMTL
jgi:hypothetical protein